LQVKADTE